MFSWLFPSTPATRALETETKTKFPPENTYSDIFTCSSTPKVFRQSKTLRVVNYNLFYVRKKQLDQCLTCHRAPKFIKVPGKWRNLAVFTVISIIFHDIKIFGSKNFWTRPLRTLPSVSENTKWETTGCKLWETLENKNSHKSGRIKKLKMEGCKIKVRHSALIRCYLCWRFTPINISAKCILGS